MGKLIRLPARPGASCAPFGHGFALALQAWPGLVRLLLAGNTEIRLRPEQARQLGRDLISFADTAERAEK